MISLVLGLGNIGDRYRGNRHNLGFRVLQRLIADNQLQMQPGTSKYDWAIKETETAKIIFAMPNTYMNCSGIAAKALLQRYSLEPDRMLVVVDDINLPLGRIRIRAGGSEGGHNGLASIIAELETENFSRLRLGIGPIPEGVEQVEFVLGDFKQSETESVEKMIATASEAAMFCVQHGLNEAMSEYNQNPA
ncbi:MAG: aminoacyl-tRNA hydrolase [Candidatus Zixiibacteriota bacterium]|nr:MAG: aminoacyl-tRNA hydrolase [candidate division Zixibacteria bacterium]